MMKELMMSLAVLGLAGCTAVQIPADRLQRSEASIRGAEEVGASGVPEARLHLQLAKDQTARNVHCWCWPVLNPMLNWRSVSPAKFRFTLKQSGLAKI
jgi:hypothetical protein